MSINEAISVAGHRQQRTLSKSVSISGICLHTGKNVSMQFCPAPAHTGIIFKRIDLPGQPFIPASVLNVCDTLRSTTIGKEDVRIHTVEHVLAALNAFHIDNLIIELSNMEPPIADGSSLAFVKMIEEAGIEEQKEKQSIFKLNKPIYWADEEIQMVALPYDGFRVSNTLNYPSSTILRAQFYSSLITSDTFKNEIAPCRTFSLYEEVAIMMDRGLIKGGSLDNAVIIKRDPPNEDIVFSKEGLRFPNEMVRHKMLDVVGDLSLVGFPFYAHIIAIRAGHASNYQLSKKIYHLYHGGE